MIVDIMPQKKKPADKDLEGGNIVNMYEKIPTRQ
jgi:hypothetical protein